MTPTSRPGPRLRAHLTLPVGDPRPDALWRTRHRAVGALTAAEEGHGADVVQGHLFGRPVPAADASPELLRSTASPGGEASDHLKRPTGAPMEIT